jgi:hypothetical protein
MAKRKRRPHSDLNREVANRFHANSAARLVHSIAAGWPLKTKTNCSTLWHTIQSSSTVMTRGTGAIRCLQEGRPNKNRSVGLRGLDDLALAALGYGTRLQCPPSIRMPTSHLQGMFRGKSGKFSAVVYLRCRRCIGAEASRDSRRRVTFAGAADGTRQRMARGSGWHEAADGTRQRMARGS